MNRNAKKSLIGLICFFAAVFWFLFVLASMISLYDVTKDGHSPLTPMVFLVYTLGGVGVVCVLKSCGCFSMRVCLGILSWLFFSILFLGFCIMSIGITGSW